MTHSIRVFLSKRQEWYIATSPDMRGLFVTDPSLGEVYQEIPEVIRLLFKVQHGVDVVVRDAAAPEKRSLDSIMFIAEEVRPAA